MPSSNTSTTARTGGFLSLTQPSESADGYFPRGATASNTIKTSSTRSESPLDDPPSASNSSIGSSNHPLSPLDRNYTKPLGGGELNIAEQLEKEPTYWSARGWVQRSVTATTNGATMANAQDNAAARARKFEETKKDLLASVGRF